MYLSFLFDYSHLYIYMCIYTFLSCLFACFLYIYIYIYIFVTGPISVIIISIFKEIPEIRISIILGSFKGLRLKQVISPPPFFVCKKCCMHGLYCGVQVACVQLMCSINVPIHMWPLHVDKYIYIYIYIYILSLSLSIYIYKLIN